MKKPAKGKLSLDRETLVPLVRGDLVTVAGGNAMQMVTRVTNMPSVIISCATRLTQTQWPPQGQPATGANGTVAGGPAK